MKCVLYRNYCQCCCYFSGFFASTFPRNTLTYPIPSTYVSSGGSLCCSTVVYLVVGWGMLVGVLTLLKVGFDNTVGTCNDSVGEEAAGHTDGDDTGDSEALEETDEDVDSGKDGNGRDAGGGRAGPGGFFHTHVKSSLWQWWHTGCSSVHFFFRRLHVRHPLLDLFPCFLFLPLLTFDLSLAFVLFLASVSVLSSDFCVSLLFSLYFSPLFLPSEESSSASSLSTGLSKLASM